MTTATKELTIDLGLNDKAIDEMERLYLPLKLQGVNDKDGYNKIVEYRKNTKQHRLTVTKAHKAGKANALKVCNNWDTEKNRLLDRIAPIENHLIEQEGIVKKEKERIKAEEQAKKQEAHQKRIQAVIDAGAVFNGSVYVYGDDSVSDADLWNFHGSEFTLVIAGIGLWKRNEDLRLAEEARIKKEEEERQAKIAADQKAKQEELDRVAEEQAEQARKLKEDQDKIDEQNRKQEETKRIEEAKKTAIVEAEKKAAAEKKKHEEEIAAAKKKAIEDEKQHKIDLEKAKKKAAEDAKKEAEKKAREKIEADKKAAAAAEKKAKLAPDKDKLIEYGNLLYNLDPPVFKTSEAKIIIQEHLRELHEIAAKLIDKAGEL